MKLQTFKTLDGFVKNIKKGDFILYENDVDIKPEIILSMEKIPYNYLRLTSFYDGEILVYDMDRTSLCRFRKPIL